MDYQFDLVRTNYPVEEGREVLLSLISDKINFLERTIFSLEERFGSDTSHLVSRVKELRAERESLKTFLASLEDKNMMLSIHCPVTIECKEIKNESEVTEAYAK